MNIPACNLYFGTLAKIGADTPLFATHTVLCGWTHIHTLKQ